MIHALVPIASLEHAKLRLQPVLAPHERRALVLAMLGDVLETLFAVRDIEGVVVVTPDETVCATSLAHGAEVIREPAARGLNAAVTAGIDEASRRGWKELLIIPGDVPLATAQEFGAVVSASLSSRYAVLTPSRDEQGTNAFLLAPPDLLRPAFGQASFERHMHMAQAKGVTPRVVRLHGLGRDIDLPVDLKYLLAKRRGTSRYDFLERLAREDVMPIRPKLFQAGMVRPRISCQLRKDA